MYIYVINVIHCAYLQSNDYRQNSLINFRKGIILLNINANMLTIVRNKQKYITVDERSRFKAELKYL